MMDRWGFGILFSAKAIGMALLAAQLGTWEGIFYIIHITGVYVGIRGIPCLID